MKGIVLSILIYALFLNRSKAQTEAQDWKPDLDSIYFYLNNTHPNPYLFIDSISLNKSYLELSSQLDSMSEIE